jgi:hypothetical protein
VGEGVGAISKVSTRPDLLKCLENLIRGEGIFALIVFVILKLHKNARKFSNFFYSSRKFILRFLLFFQNGKNKYDANNTTTVNNTDHSCP